MESKIICDFNSLFYQLATQVSILCPKTFICKNIDVLEQIIKNDPEKVISLFTKYVLKYKQPIDRGDDDFFLNNPFDIEIQRLDRAKAKSLEYNVVKRIFEFKEIWKKQRQDNKDTIVQYMQFLCQLSLKYLNIKLEQNVHIDINTAN